MKYLLSIILLISFAISAVPNNTTEPPSAKQWLERLSHTLRQENFTSSFVVIKNNHAEPYHWLHGLGNRGQELEIFARLNGPRRDVLRHGEIVSYIEPEQAPYSIITSDLVSPIPKQFRGNVAELEGNYRLMSVGRSRVLGRVAQFIRIEAKDEFRFSYWLWLDHKTGLLLKMAVVSPQGKILEQIQFTHVEVTTALSENLVQLQATELPAVNKLNTAQHKELAWKANWLPQGFKSVKSNQHRLSSDYHPETNNVEFRLFTDGLVDVSVYVNLNNAGTRAAEYASDGATLVFNHIVQGVEISVVGDIPLVTAKKIANSIIAIED